MGSIQLDLGLRLKQSHVPKSIGRFLNDLRKLDSVTDKLSMLEIYLQMLKKEYSRVEPFRTDLPLCVQLLVDSIELLNGEIVKLGESTPTNALMNSLTFEANYYAQKQKQVEAVRDQTNKHLKFQPENGSSITPNAKSPRIELVNDDYLSHQPPKISEPIWKNNRRSWSPELHAIFLEALNSLGGPEVAKPKQIKEVMKIDGLTNDQIKSHLQKYRLQMKAFPAMNSNVGNGEFETTCGQEMFCRDLWMPSTSSPYLSPSQLQARENAEVSAIASSQMQIGDRFRSEYGFEHCLSQCDGSKSAHMYRKYI